MQLIGNYIRDFKIVDFIDSGSFGSVYKAQKNEKFYAIKIFREDYILREYRERGEKNRIRREIEIMRSVTHPNLIKYIDDFKETIAGVPSYFLVMEFANGSNLRKLLNHRKLSENEAYDIFIDILDGLNALHNIRGDNDENGIIHRDLKPENIIVCEKNVKILDYGISKVIDYTTITKTGEILGSPIYMSPEQIKDSKHLDKRSDIYTLGVILYEMLTNKLPYEFNSLPELYDKILNSPPIPPRKWNMLIDNKVENIILKLLEKHPYQRFNSANELKEVFLNRNVTSVVKSYDTEVRFYVRLYDEKSAIENFSKRYPEKINVIFPINYKDLRQTKNIIPMLKSGNFRMILDPATVRLAYPAQQNVKGLQNLSYAPKKFNVITPGYLSSNSSKQKYVKQVLDEQVSLQPNILVSPFHYVHNTNVAPTQKRNPMAEWFDLDLKLIKESIDYKNSDSRLDEFPLYAGICINSNSLLDEVYRTDFLNIFSAIDCDEYLIYVDNISKDTDSATLYHYVTTLVALQSSTQKPVIAGRINSLGLGLICSGISGFSSGTARFDSFYEGLYKEESESYNMTERYYLPEFLGIIPIPKNNPIRLKTIIDKLGSCDCHYCQGKEFIDIIKAPNNKLHFLECMHKEVNTIKKIPSNERLSYFLNRIDKAISNYQLLPEVFKPANYRYLSNWKEVFTEISKN